MGDLDLQRRVLIATETLISRSVHDVAIHVRLAFAKRKGVPLGCGPSGLRPRRIVKQPLIYKLGGRGHLLAASSGQWQKSSAQISSISENHVTRGYERPNPFR